MDECLAPHSIVQYNDGAKAALNDVLTRLGISTTGLDGSLYKTDPPRAVARLIHETLVKRVDAARIQAREDGDEAAIEDFTQLRKLLGFGEPADADDFRANPTTYVYKEIATERNAFVQAVRATALTEEEADFNRRCAYHGAISEAAAEAGINGHFTNIKELVAAIKDKVASDADTAAIRRVLLVALFGEDGSTVQLAATETHRAKALIQHRFNVEVAKLGKVAAGDTLAETVERVQELAYNQGIKAERSASHTNLRMAQSVAAARRTAAAEEHERIGYREALSVLADMSGIDRSKVDLTEAAEVYLAICTRILNKVLDCGGLPPDLQPDVEIVARAIRSKGQQEGFVRLALYAGVHSDKADAKRPSLLIDAIKAQVVVGGIDERAARREYNKGWDAGKEQGQQEACEALAKRLGVPFVGPTDGEAVWSLGVKVNHLAMAIDKHFMANHLRDLAVAGALAVNDVTSVNAGVQRLVQRGYTLALRELARVTIGEGRFVYDGLKTLNANVLNLADLLREAETKTRNSYVEGARRGLLDDIATDLGLSDLPECDSSEKRKELVKAIRGTHDRSTAAACTVSAKTARDTAFYDIAQALGVEEPTSPGGGDLLTALVESIRKYIDRQTDVTEIQRQEWRRVTETLCNSMGITMPAEGWQSIARLAEVIEAHIARRFATGKAAELGSDQGQEEDVFKALWDKATRSGSFWSGVDYASAAVAQRTPNAYYREGHQDALREVLLAVGVKPSDKVTTPDVAKDVLHLGECRAVGAIERALSLPLSLPVQGALPELIKWLCGTNQRVEDQLMQKLAQHAGWLPRTWTSPADFVGLVHTKGVHDALATVMSYTDIQLGAEEMKRVNSVVGAVRVYSYRKLLEKLGILHDNADLTDVLAVANVVRQYIDLGRGVAMLQAERLYRGRVQRAAGLPDTEELTPQGLVNRIRATGK